MLRALRVGIWNPARCDPAKYQFGIETDRLCDDDQPSGTGVLANKFWRMRSASSSSFSVKSTPRTLSGLVWCWREARKVAAAGRGVEYGAAGFWGVESTCSDLERVIGKLIVGAVGVASDVGSAEDVELMIGAAGVGSAEDVVVAVKGRGSCSVDEGVVAAEGSEEADAAAGGSGCCSIGAEETGG